MFAGLTAVVVVLGGIALHGMTVEPPVPPVEIEYVDLNVDESGPDFASPELETPDEQLSSELSERGGVAEALTAVNELESELSPIAVRQFESFTPPSDESSEDGSANAGSTGARERLPIGVGCRAMIPPEQRWFIMFDESTLNQYARQLDFFDIELGAYVPARPPKRGRLVYLGSVSSSNPEVRESDGASDGRLYLMWQADRFAERDRALFRRAGIEMPGASFVLFLNAKTEQLILKTEEAWRGRKASEIRRTYFRVVPDGAGFRFKVTSQSYRW